ncbi:S8 family serine peptidase [Jiella mangrovi]|uniref:S8 family serine peptidase n=1 Tax=Jiella mangrovi TaxID=2821407 RepID=A0ABS4BII5_9HYPH|nr:S8 family serine peptidase [Jiella mangrovi]MBP0616572.1 S8 family serine peptidase [Jiella mangrovi]
MVDIAADSSTTASMAVGGTFTDLLEVQGDHDWIAISLTAGQSYAIAMDGTGSEPLYDPLVSLYDASGSQVAVETDDGANYHSELVYTASVSGTFYIDAGAWFDGQSGEYTISVELEEGITEDDQWHLGYLGDLEAIWADYTGAGVNVGVYDDGVQYTHHDLDGNYDPSLHVVVDGEVLDPTPASSSDAHGTAVAGLIAAENDGTGTVGVAYGATLTGVNIFSGPADINNNLDGFLQAVDQSENFDVINHSWGHYPLFYLVNGDQETVTEWFEAAAGGRDGLGTIQMKAAGNDNANSNGELSASSRVTVSVGAYDDTGDASWYSSYGANLLISSPSNGGVEGLATTDLIGSDGYDPSDYTDSFGGTSGATPIATGVVALMLEANDGLGWRDVQNILAYSARSVGSGVGGAPTGDEEHEWFYNNAENWNGGGLHFSEDYGFGAIDAYNAVRMSEVWSLFGEAKTSVNEGEYSSGTTTGQALTDNGVKEIDITFSPPPFSVEYVDLTVDVTHDNLSELLIELVSAEGTSVELFNGALGDATYLSGQLSWTFGANAFRGEDGIGTWTVRITDGAAGNTGTLNSYTLTLYGIDETLTAGATFADVYHYTNEYSDVAGVGGHATTVTDTDGGADWVDAAAVSSDTIIQLRSAYDSFINGVATVFSNIENAVTGDGDDTLVGSNGDNVLVGMRGKDVLVGLGGNDRLDGGAGADEMRGNTGDDTYVVDNYGDTITENANEGIDTVESARSIVLYSFGGNLENLTLTGAAAVNGTGNALANTILGNSAANVLMGLAGADIMKGFNGADTLDGGSGADAMYGGRGSDSYYVDNAGDTITELEGEGALDRVFSSISFKLYTQSQYLEALTLTGTADIDGTGNARNNTIVGNSGANVLNGGNGNDILIGNAGDDIFNDLSGADAMYGGRGSDTYYVDNVGDTITELKGEGALDQVFSSISFKLYTQSQYLETLTLTGTADIDGMGNARNNTITGNSGANVLNGGSGNDLLIGNGGNDIFDDTSGADDMRGGTGNDTYFVDDAGDTITENAGEGTDTVKSAMSTVLYSFGGSLENLTLIGTGNVDATGNGANNVIIGNSGNNILLGLNGADRLTGGGGADIFDFNTIGQSGMSAATRDTITDFQQGVDLIDLSGIDALSTTAADDAFTFIGMAPHSGAGATLRYAQTGGNTIIYGDVDANGGGDFSLLLEGLYTLTQDDFVL